MEPMSDISVRSYSTVPDLQARQTKAPDSGKHGVQGKASGRHPAALADPTDIIDTSPAANAALSALNSNLSVGNPEEQKEFDAQQLKNAVQQLHFLQLLGVGLPAE